MCGEPCDGVADVDSPCFGNQDGVAPIRVSGGAYIPSIHVMGCPAAACIRLGMGQDMCAGWGNRCAIGVKGAMDVFSDRQLGVASASVGKI